MNMQDHHRFLPVAVVLTAASLLAGCATSPATDTARPATQATTNTEPAADSPREPEASRERNWVVDASTPMLDRAVTSFGSTVLDGQLYVLGGYHGEPHHYDKTGQSGRLAALDLSTRTWKTLAGVEHLQSVELVPWNGKLVRVGGMRAMNEPGTEADMRSLDEVAAYDPAADAWTPLAKLPANRSSHGCTVVDGKIYVVGGWTLGGNAGSGSFAEQTWVSDANGEHWTAIDQPWQRRAVGVGAVGHFVVAVGGLGDGGKPSKKVNVLDTKTGTWRDGPEFPGEGFGVAVQGLGDRLYASGMDGTVYALDLNDDAWTPVTKLAFPRFFHQLVPSGQGELMAVGGIHGMTVEDRIRVLEPIAVDAASGSPRTLTWTLEAPSAVKNRQGAFVYDDSLYLFGGNVSLGQHDFEPEHFSDAGRRLHLTSMRWSEVASFPNQRQSMQTVVPGSSSVGYSVGGFGHDGEVARTHTEVFAYDFGNNTWSPRGGGLPVSRTQFGLTEHDGDLWIFGGLDFDPRRKGQDMFRHLTSILRAQPGQDDFDTSVKFEASEYELREPRRAFASAELDGRYYLVGGMKDGFKPVEQSEYFDFETGKWKNIAAPKSQRIGADLIAAGGALYLVGGTELGDPEKAEASRVVERYDPKTNRWSVFVEELPFDMRHARTFGYAGNLLIFSTHREATEAKLAIVTLPPAK